MATYDSEETRQAGPGAAPATDRGMAPGRMASPARSGGPAPTRRWFWNPFAANVSFTVNGTRIAGKDGSAPTELPTLQLFPGATFSADKNSAVGNKRGGSVWVEGHDGRLDLNAPHLRSVQPVGIEQFWIGLRNSERPDSASIMLNSGTAVTLQSARHTLTALLLFKPEDKDDLLLTGVSIINSGTGEAVLSEPMARVGTDGITSLESDTDLFARAEQLDPAQPKRKGEDDTSPRADATVDDPAAAEEPQRKVTIAQLVQSGLAGRSQKSHQTMLDNAAQQEEEAEEEPEDDEDEDEEEEDDQDKNGQDEDTDDDDTQDADEDRSLADTVKAKLAEYQQEIQEYIDKLESIPEIAKSWKLGEAYGVAEGEHEPVSTFKSDGKGNTSYELTLADVPILLPFVFGSVSLVASTSLGLGFTHAFNADDTVARLKGRASDELHEIVEARQLRLSAEQGQKKIAEAKSWIDEFLKDADIKVDLGVYLMGNARIGLQLAANAGLPGILLLEAGVMGGVGGKGADGGKIASGTVSAVIHLNGDLRDVTLDDLQAVIKGGLLFYFTLNGSVGLKSPLFSWKKELVSKGVEKPLGSVEGLMEFRKQGAVHEFFDLFRGWEMTQSYISPKGFLDSFLEENPKDQGFNIFDTTAYELPVKLADEAIESADTFIATFEPLMAGGAGVNELNDLLPARAQAGGIIEELERAKAVAQDVLKAAAEKQQSTGAVDKIKKTIDVHQARLDRLQKATKPSQVTIIKDGELMGATEFYDHSYAFGSFLGDEMKDEATAQVATRDALLAYERKRLDEIRNPREFVQLKALRDAYADAAKQNQADTEQSALAAFNGYYVKHYKSSPLVRGLSMSADADTLYKFEIGEFFRRNGKRMGNIPKMQKKCAQLGIAVPRSQMGRAGYRILEGDTAGSDGAELASAHEPNKEFYDFYVKDIDSGVKKHLAELASERQLETYLRDCVNESVFDETKSIFKGGSAAQDGRARGVLGLYEVLCALDPSDQASLKGFKDSNRDTLVSMLKKNDSKFWLFMSGEDMKRHEMRRAIELAPNVRALDAHGKKKDVDARNDFLARSGLVTLLYQVELDRYAQMGDKGSKGAAAQKRRLDELASCIEKNNGVMDGNPLDMNAVRERLRETNRIINEFVATDKLWSTLKSALDRADTKELTTLLAGIQNIADAQAANGASGDAWAGYHRHMKRLAGMEGIEDMSREDALRLYVAQEGRKDGVGAGKGYFDDLRKRYGKKYKDPERALDEADYGQLRAYLYTVLDNQGFKVTNSLAEKDRSFRALERLKAADDPGQAVIDYGRTKAGAAFSKHLAKNAGTEVTPFMLFTYEERVRKQLGARHDERLQLIRQGRDANMPYEELLGKYKGMVINQSRSRTWYAAITRSDAMDIVTKFDKMLKRQGATLSWKPEDIVAYEQKVIDRRAQKHLDRIAELEKLQDGEAVGKEFLATSARRFMRQNKKAIRNRAESLKRAAKADPQRMFELYAAYESKRVANASKRLGQLTSGPDQVSQKISEIDAALQKLIAFIAVDA